MLSVQYTQLTTFYGTWMPANMCSRPIMSVG